MTAAIIDDRALTLRSGGVRIRIEHFLGALPSDLSSTILFLGGRLLVRLVMALHHLLLVGCELNMTLSTN